MSRERVEKPSNDEPPVEQVEGGTFVPHDKTPDDEVAAKMADAEAAQARVEESTGEPTAPASNGETTPPDETASDELPTEGRPRLEQGVLGAIVEALVFASPDPLTPRTLFKLLSDEPKEDVVAAIDALKRDYAERGGLQLAEVAGGYQITTRPEFHEWVRRLFHERTTQKLSVQALETLAVIAYKQPITAAEIGEIRGVNTAGVLTTLLERHLIKIVGRKNVIGRPFLYGTTKEFLIRFGLNDLSDLPRVEEMAHALGFDAPTLLTERTVREEMLPLDENDE